MPSQSDSPRYVIDVCPVCREQIPDVDGLAPSHWHDAYGYVSGISVPAEPIGLDEAIKAQESALRKQKAAHKRREKLEREADRLREQAADLEREAGRQ